MTPKPTLAPPKPTVSHARRPRPGREAPNAYRRNEHAQRAILAAAVDLAIELGYEGASVEGIAKRAGVGKQTIYRWGPSKGAVLLEALNERLAPVVEFTDTGDIVADLRSELAQVVELFRARPIGTVYRQFLTAAQSDQALAQAHHDQMVQPGIEAFRRRLSVARERGEVRADIDDDTLMDMLHGAIFRRVLFQTRPLDLRQIDASLTIAFEGVRERPTAVSNPPTKATSTSTAPTRHDGPDQREAS